MNTRRVFWIICVIAAGTLLTAVAVWARAAVAGQTTFTANGASIAGWYWLRATGHTATWTISTASIQGAKPGSVYLNFSPLVTNGVNGGSGYATTCKLTVVGRTTVNYTISLTNPYRPIDPENSSGVGYQCYGHSSPLPTAVWKGAQSLKVSVAYPFSANRHVAVNKNCLYLGYSK